MPGRGVLAGAVGVHSGDITMPVEIGDRSLGPRHCRIGWRSAARSDSEGDAGKDLSRDRGCAQIPPKVSGPNEDQAIRVHRGASFLVSRPGRCIDAQSGAASEFLRAPRVAVGRAV
jgi:hypothetical protein